MDSGNIIGRARSQGMLRPHDVATPRFSCSERHEMKVVVKAAHCIRKHVYLRRMIGGSLIEAAFSKLSLKELAMNEVLFNEKFQYRNKGELLIHRNVFDAIYPLCCENDRRILERSLSNGLTLREFRLEVDISFEPRMKVGALKLLLKSVPWIPEKNLVLVREDEARPLEDDCSTLDDCGIEDGDSVLACMGGSFPVTICDTDPLLDEEFVIPISSCFETVGELKKKIDEKTGKDPDEMYLFHQDWSISENDNAPLVGHGIVRQYWNMEKEYNVIEMYTESGDRKLALASRAMLLQLEELKPLFP